MDKKDWVGVYGSVMNKKEADQMKIDLICLFVDIDKSIEFSSDTQEAAALRWVRNRLYEIFPDYL